MELVKPRPGKRNGYQPPLKKCSGCKQKKRVYQLIEGKPVCKDCSEIPEHKCGICGKTKKSNYKDSKKGHICVDCYEAPKHICDQCKDYVPIAKRTKSGELICYDCYTPPLRICQECGKQRALAIKNPPTCHTCYGRERQRRLRQKKSR